MTKRPASSPKADTPATLEPPPLTDAQRLGHTPIAAAVPMPAIQVDDPNVANIARAICENLPPYSIFRRGDSYLTLERLPEDEDGISRVETRTFDKNANRLRVYLGDRLEFRKGSGEKIRRVSLSKDLAGQLLESDVWRHRFPEIRLILHVRLPVWSTGADGKRCITLTPAGYDARRRLYTAETLNYAEGVEILTPQQAVNVWNSLMYTFPWDVDKEMERRLVWKLGDKVINGPQPSCNRSACVCLALMLGQYVRLLVDDLMPIGVFNANQPGSGKSLLAWMCVSPVWGMAPGAPCPMNGEEMIKSISSAMMAGEPFYMLDDVTGLNSNTLNMVATSNEVTGRKLGGNDMFRVKNEMQIFATGNALQTSADVERRSLICDLFLATDALERKFETTFTKKTLAAPGMRADLLRFMYSMVRNWSDAGCPELVSGNKKPTFETFASVVGSIMVHNGFLSPFTERRHDGAGGDTLSNAIMALLSYIVTDKMEGEKVKRFTVAEIVEISDKQELTQAITGGAKHVNNSMGRHLGKFRERILTAKNGQRYQFGKREESAQSAYTFILLD